MIRRLSLLAFVLLAPLAWAGPTVDLTGEAQRPVANDLLRAVVFVESEGSDPAALAGRVNQEIREALALIQREKAVKVRSGGQHAYPVSGPQRRIENWRMRSELWLESGDTAALSALLGQLQQRRLAVGSLQPGLAPATRREAEAALTREAIRDFEQRATLVAETLGKPYRIRHLSVHAAGDAPPPLPLLRGARAMAAAEAAPMPVEAGESTLRVSVSGQIELAD